MTGLRRFLDRTGPGPAVERCELCATPVPSEHPHLVHVTERHLRCACGPCAFLFDAPGAGGYRRVPDRYLTDPGFDPTGAGWEALQVPVGVAFFLRSSVAGGIVACYPGPAGATESQLPLHDWEHGLGASPLAGELAEDVEALLVRRSPAACLLVPVDACYRLVGLARRHWRGFDGGAEAQQAIEEFFADASARAVPVGPGGRPGTARTAAAGSAPATVRADGPAALPGTAPDPSRTAGTSIGAAP